MTTQHRAEREIAHGKLLAAGDTETLWGWGTPAGKLRARRRGTLIANGAALADHKHVLEIGCGTGLFTTMFAASGASIVAVDISPELIAKARDRDLPASQVRFLVQRFEDCDVEGPFDAVIGSSVLHHLVLDEALSHIYSLLKPGGWLSFAEPNLLNPQVLAMFRLRFLFPEISPDEDALIRWSFARQLADHGYTDITIHPFDWLHPSTPERYIPLVRQLGHWCECTPGLREFAGSLAIRARRPLEDAQK
jgi:SAM-dependent methyltransferase